MICPFCNDGKNVRKWNKGGVEEHLIVTKSFDNHFHVHGPIGDKNMILEFVRHICKEAGIETEIEA